MAFLAVRMLSRRRLLRMFQVPGLLLIPLVVFLPAVRDADMSWWGIFALGLVTVAQFNFWGNYLPLVYPVHLRGTGESFAANIGGRMFGTSAALLTTSMVAYMPGGNATRQLGVCRGDGRVFSLTRLISSRASGCPSPKPGQCLPPITTEQPRPRRLQEAAQAQLEAAAFSRRALPS